MPLQSSRTSKCAALLVLLFLSVPNGLLGQTATDFPLPSYQALLQDNAEADSTKKPQQQDEQLYQLIKLFVDTLDQIDRNYVKEVDRRELIDGAIQGMLGKLDREYTESTPGFRRVSGKQWQPILLSTYGIVIRGSR